MIKPLAELSALLYGRNTLIIFPAQIHPFTNRLDNFVTGIEV